jgi:hypothetical protein
MTICPAAIKSPSPKIFWKNHSLFAAGTGLNIFAVKAIPAKGLSTENKDRKREIWELTPINVGVTGVGLHDRLHLRLVIPALLRVRALHPDLDDLLHDLDRFFALAIRSGGRALARASSLSEWHYRLLRDTNNRFDARDENRSTVRVPPTELDLFVAPPLEGLVRDAFGAPDAIGDYLHEYNQEKAQERNGATHPHDSPSAVWTWKRVA